MARERSSACERPLRARSGPTWLRLEGMPERLAYALPQGELRGERIVQDFRRRVEVHRLRGAPRPVGSQRSTPAAKNWPRSVRIAAQSKSRDRNGWIRRLPIARCRKAKSTSPASTRGPAEPPPKKITFSSRVDLHQGTADQKSLAFAYIGQPALRDLHLLSVNAPLSIPLLGGVTLDHLDY